jgi:DNA helicase INO80
MPLVIAGQDESDQEDLKLEQVKDEPVDFSNLNFDDATDEQLKDQAKRNVASALMAQKHKTQQFDESVRDERQHLGSHEDVDISECKYCTIIQHILIVALVNQMSFLNPSSMPTSLEVPQPKLLTCTLKPYQMKGLSWLANLYEQVVLFNNMMID